MSFNRQPPLIIDSPIIHSEWNGPIIEILDEEEEEQQQIIKTEEKTQETDVSRINSITNQIQTQINDSPKQSSQQQQQQSDATRATLERLKKKFIKKKPETVNSETPTQQIEQHDNQQLKSETVNQSTTSTIQQSQSIPTACSYHSKLSPITTRKHTDAQCGAQRPELNKSNVNSPSSSQTSSPKLKSSAQLSHSSIAPISNMPPLERDPSTVSNSPARSIPLIVPSSWKNNSPLIKPSIPTKSVSGVSTLERRKRAYEDDDEVTIIEQKRKKTERKEQNRRKVQKKYIELDAEEKRRDDAVSNQAESDDFYDSDGHSTARQSYSVVKENTTVAKASQPSSLHSVDEHRFQDQFDGISWRGDFNIQNPHSCVFQAKIQLMKGSPLVFNLPLPSTMKEKLRMKLEKMEKTVIQKIKLKQMKCISFTLSPDNSSSVLPFIEFCNYYTTKQKAVVFDFEGESTDFLMYLAPPQSLHLFSPLFFTKLLGCDHAPDSQSMFGVYLVNEHAYDRIMQTVNQEFKQRQIQAENIKQQIGPLFQALQSTHINPSIQLNQTNQHNQQVSSSTPVAVLDESAANYLRSLLQKVKKAGLIDQEQTSTQHQPSAINQQTHDQPVNYFGQTQLTPLTSSDYQSSFPAPVQPYTVSYAVPHSTSYSSQQPVGLQTHYSSYQNTAPEVAAHQQNQPTDNEQNHHLLQQTVYQHQHQYDSSSSVYHSELYPHHQHPNSATSYQTIHQQIPNQ